MTEPAPYAVGTRGDDDMSESPEDNLEWGLNDYVVNIRLPRALWLEWGQQVGTGENRSGGRSGLVVDFIKREVRRNRTAPFTIGRNWHEEMGKD